MSDTTLIRKYVNRRLYDTSQSRYVNLDDLRALIVEGNNLKVVEQASGADITTQVLLQIIAESQKAGASLLRPEFLCDLIRLAAKEREGSDLANRLYPALRNALREAPTPVSTLPTAQGPGPVSAQN